jgi:hypothetical protein
MEIGALIRSTYDYQMYRSRIRTGVIIDTDINMWGEEVLPSGVKILWSNFEIEVVFSDEVEVISD